MFVDSPYHRQYGDRHGRHQPKEQDFVIQVVLPRVIAKNCKYHQCHLVHQMVNDGEPLHAKSEIVTFDNLSQPLNASVPIVVKLLGILIEAKLEHNKNALNIENQRFTF